MLTGGVTVLGERGRRWKGGKVTMVEGPQVVVMTGNAFTHCGGNLI